MDSRSHGTEVATEEQINQIVALINTLKDAGNAAIKRSDNDEAIKLYSQGIEAARAIPTRISSQLFSQLYSNRATAHFSKGRLVETVDDCRKAIDLDPCNLKAYYRGAKASMGLDLFRQACEFCEKGLQENPDSRDLMDLLESCRARFSSYQEVKAVEARGFTQDDATNCQNQLRQITEQYQLLQQKIASMDFDISRSRSTCRALSDLEAVPCYKSLGRAFVLNHRMDIMTELENRVVQSSKDKVQLQETLSTLAKRKHDAEREMSEIIEFFRKQTK